MAILEDIDLMIECNDFILECINSINDYSDLMTEYRDFIRNHIHFILEYYDLSVMYDYLIPHKKDKPSVS